MLYEKNPKRNFVLLKYDKGVNCGLIGIEVIMPLHAVY